jgi:fatty acid desaturase
MGSIDLGFDVLASEQALAIRQARHQVAVDAATVALFVGIWTLTGFSRQLAWSAGIVVPGLIRTAVDLRWWQWLRDAAPADAYDRLQARSDLDPAAARPWLTGSLSVGLIATWWLLAR